MLAARSPEQGPFRLNLIALAETTLEYFRLIDKHAVITRRFADSPGGTLSVSLPPFIGGRRYGADEDGRYDFDASGDPGVDAFEALWRLEAQGHRRPSTLGHLPFNIRPSSGPSAVVRVDRLR
jgi:hypothetical protein